MSPSPASTIIHIQPVWFYVHPHPLSSLPALDFALKANILIAFKDIFIKSSLAGLRAISPLFLVTLDISALIRTRLPESNFYISPGRALTVILIAQEYHSEHRCPARESRNSRLSVCCPGLGPRAGLWEGPRDLPAVAEEQNAGGDGSGHRFQAMVLKTWKSLLENQLHFSNASPIHLLLVLTSCWGRGSEAGV